MFEFYYTKVFAGGQDDSLAWFWKVFPVITLLIGIAVQRSLIFLDTRRKNKKAADVLLTEVLLLDEPLRWQLEQIDNFISEQSKRSVELTELNSSKSMNLGRLYSGDRAAIVDHFTRVKKSREKSLVTTNKLLNLCELITIHHHRVDSLYNEYQRRGAECANSWQSHINAWLVLYASLVAGVEKKGDKIEDDAFIMALYPFYELATRPREEDLYFYLDNLHVPHISVTAKYRTDDRVESVTDLNAKARWAILEFDSLRKDFVRQFKNLREDLARDGRSLIELSRELSNSKSGERIKEV